MPHGPWWSEHVGRLLEPAALGALGLGALYRLNEGLRFVRDNVDASLLPHDFRAHPETEAVWAGFLEREREVGAALGVAQAKACRGIAAGEVSPSGFRQRWQTLGYRQHATDGGTPADDYLDGLYAGPTPTLDLARPPEGSPNMASRAERTSDFLAVMEPSASDVVMDLGSGSGKLALTVAASSEAHVVGVEYVAEYVAEARRSAHALGLRRLRFEQADARAVDLSEANVFYLYFPFRGAVARAVAEALGRLARERPIRIFAAGPGPEFGDHFLREVEAGALELRERRGEFGQVLVLGSR